MRDLRPRPAHYRAALREGPDHLGEDPERTAVVTAITEAAADTIQLELALEADENGAGCEFDPGQFLELTIPGTASHRSYSLANTPNWDGAAGFFIKLRAGGEFSRFLREVEPGQRLAVRGPQGAFGLRDTGIRPRWFIAGGTGLSPLLSMLERMAGWSEPHPGRLWFGVHADVAIFGTEVLDALAGRLPGFRYDVVVGHPSNDWRGAVGRPTDHLAEALAQTPEAPDIYVCGPPGMVAATTAIARRAGLPAKRVVVESFAPLVTRLKFTLVNSGKNLVNSSRRERGFVSTATAAPSRHVVENWDPENNWDSRLAWRTLIVSTFSLIIAFCVWFLVSAIAPKLNAIGFHLTKSQLYWLTAMPGLSGGLIRLVYMFLPPVIGTRKLVGISSLLYLIPMLGWFFAVQNTSTGYGTLLVLSFLCGIGGGSFSGYMPSTGYFFPKRKVGTALGIQAGVGNLGMSIIQLLGPWLMGFGLLGITWIAPEHAGSNPLWVHNAAIVFIPWTILAAILAFVLLKDVPVKANFRQQIDIFSNPNTWIMTLMYVMTFGLFSGFSAQFGLLINNTFGDSSSLAGKFSNLPAGATYAFLGPLIGSLVRVAWGPLCDRFGGAIWTLVSGIGMTITLAFCTFFLNPTSPHQFVPFLWGMLAMFFFAGIGNAGTFKQMPMIMPGRQAGGAIGFTAAIGCFGPFVIGVALSGIAASTWFWICAAFCLLCSVVCWFQYARPKAPFPG